MSRFMSAHKIYLFSTFHVMDPRPEPFDWVVLTMIDLPEAVQLHTALPAREGSNGVVKNSISDIGPTKSLVVPERNHFQHIIRLLNTNVDGRVKIQIALTSVKGVGRRFANIACKKADIDLTKRAGELSSEELERIVTILQNPAQYKIPTWFLNRQKDIVDGKSSQVISNVLDTKYRDDLERLKKIRNHRGLRHYWGVRVRGQHTKTTGRRGRTVGVSKKK